jgi:hypothetical protein
MTKNLDVVDYINIYYNMECVGTLIYVLGNGHWERDSVK